MLTPSRLPSRQWATPLTIGGFLLIAVTGVLMFFHLTPGLTRQAHEWLGWALIAAVALHALANAPAFLRYLQRAGSPRRIVGASVVLLLACLLLPAPPQSSPPALVMGAIADAPLTQTAALAGKSVDEARSALAAAGIAVDDGQQSLRAATGGNRAQIGLAVRVLFDKAPAPERGT